MGQVIEWVDLNNGVIKGILIFIFVALGALVVAKKFSKKWICLFKKDNPNSNMIYTLNLHDKAVDNTREDYFYADTRYVKQIHKLISDDSFSPLAIAITGEWGIGKTSVINLLSKKLEVDKKTILIRFEPLLEGELEIIDIIQLFYLRLSQKLTDSEFQKIIKRTLKSIAILARSKITGEINLPLYKIKGEVNLERNIDDVLKTWKKDTPISFSEQTKQLNTILKKENYRLCIIIDDVDRLQSSHILNLLFFLRILEEFDDLFCIIGMDYKKVISKLIQEGQLGLSDYESVKSYLEKTFQTRFHISHSLDRKVKFAEEILLKKGLATEIVTSEDYEVHKTMADIIEYLSTPRQIKKWIISLNLYATLIEHSPQKLNFIAFLAVSVKHPVLLENVSRHTFPILCRKTWFLELFLKERYGITFPTLDETYIRKIVLSSAGIKSINLCEDKDVTKLSGMVSEYLIEDCFIESLVIDFLLKSPVYLISLFIIGYTDEDSLSAYADFFNLNINNTLTRLKDDVFADALAFDLSESLRHVPIDSNATPSLVLLNEIWINKAEIGNPYHKIVLSALRNSKIEEIIAETHIVLSQEYIIDFLSMFNIKNENSAYNLEKFKNIKLDNGLNNFISNNTFGNVSAEEMEEINIKMMLEKWIEKFETELNNGNIFNLNFCGLMSILYRYIQWGNTINVDKRGHLSLGLLSYLNDNSINDDKKKEVIQYITNECKTYNESQPSPIQALFNNDDDVIKRIIEFSEKNKNVKNIDYFKKTVNMI